MTSSCRRAIEPLNNLPSPRAGFYVALGLLCCARLCAPSIYTIQSARGPPRDSQAIRPHQSPLTSHHSRFRSWPYLAISSCHHAGSWGWYGTFIICSAYHGQLEAERGFCGAYFAQLEAGRGFCGGGCAVLGRGLVTRRHARRYEQVKLRATDVGLGAGNEDSELGTRMDAVGMMAHTGSSKPSCLSYGR